MSEQRRRHQRVPSAIPFTLDDGSDAVTRDLSPSGVYFETDGEVALGSVVRFSLQFDNPSGDLLFQCVARVVRINSENGKLGVGAQIVESHLERKDSAIDRPYVKRARATVRVR
jgi:hypothetical protein